MVKKKPVFKEEPPQKEEYTKEELDIIKEKDHHVARLNEDLTSEKSSAVMFAGRKTPHDLQKANALISARLKNILGKNRQDIDYGKVDNAWHILQDMMTKKPYTREELENIFHDLDTDGIKEVIESNLDKGKLEGYGTFNELVENNIKFKNLTEANKSI